LDKDARGVAILVVLRARRARALAPQH
jgi:hypothetical protein